MSAVYVLNNQYECVGMTRPKRALALIRENKATMVKTSDIRINTVKGAVEVPMMIRLFYYVKAFGRAIHWTKRGVFERDNDICQYCGEKVYGKRATIDHVLPLCQGGKRDSYENTVCACLTCNNKKGGRTPEQARMKLLRKPAKPAVTRSLAEIHAEAVRIMNEEFGIKTGR